MDDRFSASAGDVLVPAQWSDLHRRCDHDSIERLMLAILEDALNAALGRSRAQPWRRKKTREASRVATARGQKADALAWIIDDAGDGVFAFVNVCYALRIDPQWLSAQIRRR